VLKNLIITSLLLFGNVLSAAYVYEADQDLFDLTGESGTTNLNASDDYLSVPFALDHTFTFYGEDFTSTRMATNGCLHFGLPNSGIGYNDYCGDYTPDPLPHTTYTLYAFYTDLIRDSGSKMLGKNFTDKSVFGWYNLREYNRSNTDNSFEVILWKADDSFEFRYGGLNIKNHDVLIGEQGDTNEVYTYLYYDECNTGTTNSSSCVSTDWNNSTFNTLLENGGSLYGVGSGNALDCSNPLNNEACSGYAAAYLAQQCGLDSLYSTSCPLYWDAYDDLQCSLDPQYSPSCAGYTQEDSVAYYDPDEYEYDYGYEEEYSEDNYGYEYEDEYFTDSCIDDPSYCYDDDPYYGMEFTDEEWYEIDLEEFGQEQVDEWYGTDVVFNEEGLIEWETSPLETWEELDEHMDAYDEFVELNFYEDDPLALETYEDEIFIAYEEHYDVDYDVVYDIIGEEEEFIELFEFNTIITEDIEYEEEDNYLVFENEEELDEWFEEEMEESQETIEEQVAEVEEETFEEEAIEEIYEELEEEWIAEADEEEAVLEDLEEVELVGTLEREEGSSMDMETALSVVASTVQAATASVSGTTSGTSIHATGNTVASGGSGSSTGTTTTTAVASSVSSGGVSTSSSPSISAQVSAAAIQTQNILSTIPDTTMTTTSSVVDTGTVVETDTSTSVASVSTDDTNVSTSSSSVDTSTTTMETSEVSTQVAVVEVQVQDMQGQIDNAVVDAGTASEADQIADQIVAQNIQSQQQEAETYQQETGQYGDQSTLVAYLGYNAGFTDYYGRNIPRKDDWYEPRVIYADAYIGDNISAFYQLAGDSLNKLQKLKDLQPTL